MAGPLESLTSALTGRYAIERELGQGGMATVYLAQDLKHRRPVALKVLRPELAAVLGPDRFLREIEVTARLQHPHILPLLDSGEAAGSLYYVMPYVEGESVRQRLERERQLPLDDALRIAREVADALDYAHRHEVIHRDIKPENLLLSADHAMVADFGIARALMVAGGGKLTQTGVVLGTAAYVSPEQALGAEPLDARSDVYSLGCVLYEMLAGEPPFTGATAEAVVHQHLAEEPPAVASKRRAVPAEVAQAIRRALAKAAADRFTTAAKFGAALAQTGPQTGRAGRMRAPTTSRRGRLAVTVFGLAALIALMTAVNPGRWRERLLGTRAPAIRSLAVLPLENLL